MKPLSAKQRRQDRRFIQEAAAVLNQYGFSDVRMRRPSKIHLSPRVQEIAKRLIFVTAVFPGQNRFAQFPIRRSRSPARKLADLVRMVRKARKQGYYR